MSLVAAVTIIMILLTTVTISGINTAHNAKKIAFGAEIKMIQNAVDTYYEENNAIYPIKNKAYSISVINLSAKNKKIFKDNENDGQDIDSVIVYAIDYDLIGIQNLTYGTLKELDKDTYVVSRKSGKVYYLKGLKIGNETYYTVTDDIDNLLSYNSEKNTVNSPVIKFEPSTTEWTNADVTINVKVPETCTVVSANYDSTDVKNKLTDGVKVSQNGTLTIAYTENSENKTARYIVSNIDKTPPTIDINEDMVNVETNDSVGYVKISKEDTLSGIKCVKYDYGDLRETTAYFKSTGISAKEDLIFVKNYNEPITIYVEDNAGNVTQKVISVDSETKKAAENT